MKERLVFVRDIGVAQGELSQLKERFVRYRQDHKEPEEKIRKTHDLAYKQELQMREKKDELTPARAEIDHLCDQLVCALTLWDCAFTYGHAAGIARLGAHLLNDPGTDNRALDRCL